MSSNRTQLFIVFVLSTIIVWLLLIANFYHVAIETRLAYYGLVIPHFTVILATMLVALFIMIIFWQRQSQNDRLQREFFAIVTHKFRTPLTAIRWAVEAMHKDISMQQKEDVLKQVQKSTERLMEVVDMLVGFVKFDKGLEYAYEMTSMRELIENTIEKYGEQIRLKSINFEIAPAQSIPPLFIDKSKIQFVVDMLIDNAIKYTPASGKIGISFVPNKKGVLLEVQDTGIGIKPSDKGRIFKPFYRTDEAKTMDTEGIGLGLSTVKRIVEHHGGKIWVESPGKDKGSTFYVELKAK